MRFRELLGGELDRRRGQARRYSLRRFARQLGVHHSTLSRLLRSSAPLPARTIEGLASRLGLPAPQVAACVLEEDVAAVMSAVARDGFRADSRWLATMTGRSIDRVNVALQTALRTRVLVMSARQQWHMRGGADE